MAFSSLLLFLITGRLPPDRYTAPGFSGAAPSGPRSYNIRYAIEHRNLEHQNMVCHIHSRVDAHAAVAHGLLRVFQVLRRPGRARTSRTRTRCAFASLRPAPEFASQALSDARLRQRPLPGRLRTPRTACVRGAFGQKNPPRPRSSIGYPYQAWYWLDSLTGPGSGCLCFSAVGEGFCGRSPSARVAVQGVRRWRGEKRCQRRVFQGLRRSLDARRRRSWADEGASPSETSEHRKTRTARARSRHGRRPAISMESIGCL